MFPFRQWVSAGRFHCTSKDRMPPPTAQFLDHWPQPGTCSEARVLASETQLILQYTARDDAVALIQFPLVKAFQFGSPNDEALEGHPLARSGLQRYRVHHVEHSPWIAELEKRNAVHPRHDRNTFLEHLVHYIFTFQDATLECIACEGPFGKAEVRVFASATDAQAAWAQLVAKVFP